MHRLTGCNICLLSEKASLVLLCLPRWKILSCLTTRCYLVIVRVRSSHLSFLLNCGHLLLNLMWLLWMWNVLATSFKASQMIFELACLTYSVRVDISTAQETCCLATNLRRWIRLVWQVRLAWCVLLSCTFLRCFIVWAPITRLCKFIDHLNFLNASAFHSIIWISRVGEYTLHRRATLHRWPRKGWLPLSSSCRRFLSC